MIYGVLWRLKIRRPLRSWGFDPPPGTIKSTTYKNLFWFEVSRLWSNYGRTEKVVFRCAPNSEPNCNPYPSRSIDLLSIPASATIAPLTVVGTDSLPIQATGSTSASFVAKEIFATVSIFRPRSRTACVAGCRSRFDRGSTWPHDPRRSTVGSIGVEISTGMEEESVMASMPTLARRLLRTKQAASYLSMSEWKLRQLSRMQSFQWFRTMVVGHSSWMSAILMHISRTINVTSSTSGSTTSGRSMRSSIWRPPSSAQIRSYSHDTASRVGRLDHAVPWLPSHSRNTSTARSHLSNVVYSVSRKRVAKQKSCRLFARFGKTDRRFSAATLSAVSSSHSAIRYSVAKM